MSTNFLGISSLNPDAQRLSKYFVILSSLTQASFVFTDGYLILFMFDTLDYKKAALLFAIQLLLQGLIDFPTGVFADWIGHDKVMVLAYVFHGATFLLLGLFTVIDPPSAFYYLLIVVCLRSIAVAEESGVLQTWFDNNYKKIAQEDDPENKIYGELIGKSFVITPILPLVSLIVAAFITGNYGRVRLFQLQFILIIPILLLIYRIMGQYKSVKVDFHTTKYGKMLKDGVMVMFRTKFMFFITLSYLSILIFTNVWGSFFLFPIYYGYTASDKSVNFLRATIFITGIVMSILASISSKKLEPKKWIPRVFVITLFTWNVGYLVLFHYYPLPVVQSEASLNYTAIGFVILFGLTLNYFATVFLIIYQKLMLQEIPDQNRNSFYSLLPTLGVLLSSLLYPFVGEFIDQTQNMQEAFFWFLTLPLIFGGILAYVARWSETGFSIKHKAIKTEEPVGVEI